MNLNLKYTMSGIKKNTNKYCTVFQSELDTFNSTMVFIEITDKEVYSVTLIWAKLFVIDLSDV